MYIKEKTGKKIEIEEVIYKDVCDICKRELFPSYNKIEIEGYSSKFEVCLSCAKVALKEAIKEVKEKVKRYTSVPF